MNNRIIQALKSTLLFFLVLFVGCATLGGFIALGWYLFETVGALSGFGVWLFIIIFAGSYYLDT